MTEAGFQRILPTENEPPRSLWRHTPISASSIWPSGPGWARPTQRLVSLVGPTDDSSYPHVGDCHASPLPGEMRWISLFTLNRHNQKYQFLSKFNSWQGESVVGYGGFKPFAKRTKALTPSAPPPPLTWGRWTSCQLGWLFTYEILHSVGSGFL